ncbi:MAG: toll/interleukin-1 receptor domain-containing protein, partial [Synechococcaceae cyanobacterium]
MHLFISYKRGASPDEPLALQLYEQLRTRHTVFIDQAMAVGTPWAERIDQELRQSDVLVLLLSAEAVGSEMVLAEVETAQRLQKFLGKPRILPVRVAYAEILPYPLSAYLNPLQWALWDSPADTQPLLADLERAMAGEPLPAPTPASTPPAG